MNHSPSRLAQLGNALAFALVLVVIVLGAYSLYGVLTQGWTLFSFGGSEEIRPTEIVLVQQPTLTPFSGMQVEPSMTPTPIFDQPTPAPPTATSPPQIEVAIPPTFTAAPSTPTEPPATPTETLPPSATPTPSATPLPTTPPLPTPLPPTPTPSLLFRVGTTGPDFGRGCGAHYVFGRIVDSAGNPIPGMRILVTSEFGFQIPPATSKTEPPGWYDVVISSQRSLWYVEVVDAANSPLSPTVEVLNTGNFVDGVEACWHRVDFVRN